MALNEPHERCTRRYWNPTHVAHASKLSMDAWHHSSLQSDLPQFLKQQGIRNLFLTGHFTGIDKERSPYICVLLESPSDRTSGQVGTSWGESDMILDMSRVNQKKTKIGYLHAAAGFEGAVYLINVKLSQEEASEWWDALYNSPTPPCRLYFLHQFLSSTDLDDTGGVYAAQRLLETITHSERRIKEVTVFSSDLVFGSSCSITEDFSLDSFHLEKVSLTSEFLQALSSRSKSSSNTTKALTLSHTGSTWHPWFDSFLEWEKLEELSLLGFCLSITDLIDFLKRLQNRSNTSLRSLCIGDANDHAHEMSLVVAGTSQQANSSEELVATIVDALQGSGLPFFRLQGLRLRDPAIEAQLVQNQQKYRSILKLHKKVPAKAVRLFICGDAYAGKTTLLLSLGAVCSKRKRLVHKVKHYVERSGNRSPSQRTRGIEVYGIVNDKIRISMWDMAGQEEFHAFHDHMFPDPSSTRSSPAIFMFVWSPVLSQDETDGDHKTVVAFENSFQYWLKFIASKTRQSNATRKIVVVITRKDQMVLVAEALKHSIDALQTKFNKIVEIVQVLEVDARKRSSVKPVASCIFGTAKDVLKDAETYDICKKVSRCLSSWFPHRNAFKLDQPVIKWEAFEKLCREKFQITDEDVQRAIASSLNESGELIYLNNMIVLDVNWFCHKVMGNLIHFTDSRARIITPPGGFAYRGYLESILQNDAQTTGVQATDLVELMEALHLCCRVPNDPHGRVFIAVSLSTTEAVEPLKWRGGNNKDGQNFGYLGRRLECDQKESTFLTPGFFPMLQVLFYTAFGGYNADVKLQRDVISICMISSMEIIVECGIAQGQHVIDVMVRAPNPADVGRTLKYVEDEIIQTIIRICAQPAGNQGVKLVEGVIRPDCLYEPAPLQVREDQSALIHDLELQLRKQIEAGDQMEKLLYRWKESQHLKLSASPLVHLLGTQRFEEVLLSHKALLEWAKNEANQIIDSGNSILDSEGSSKDISSSMPTRTSVHGVRVDAASTSTQPGDGLMHNNTLDNVGDTSSILPSEEESGLHIPNIADANEEQIVLRFVKTMASAIYHELQSINRRLDELRASNEDILRKLNAMSEDICQLRNDVSNKIQKIVKESLYFAVSKEQGKVPRLVFATVETVGRRRKILTSIFKDLRSVQIELFCEHRERPHKVEGQKGICVTTIDDGMLKKALPWLNGFLKLLTLVIKVGAHVGAGLDNVIPGMPDLVSILSIVSDTPGLFDKLDLEEPSSSMTSLAGCQQWLVSVLEKHGGMRESNIYEKFKLRRALYQDTHHVAWLCPEHYPDQAAAHTSHSSKDTQLVKPLPLIL